MEFNLALGMGGFVLVVLLVVIGMPIPWAMLLIGVSGITILANLGVVLPHLDGGTFWVSCSYTMAVLPLFVLMGMFAEGSRIIEQVFNALSVVMRGVRGGLLHAVIGGSAIFAACTGSTLASAATFSRISLPQLLEKKYNKYLAAGCIASSGTMAVMIPPSIAMVIYSTLTETSLGPLLIAGIIPGILNAIMLFATIFGIALVKPEWTPSSAEKTGLRERWIAVKNAPSGLFVVLLITFLLGGIYTGYFTPTQAGAMGAFGTFTIYVIRWGKRTMGPVKLLNDAAIMSAKIFFIVGGGLLFGRFLTMSGVVGASANFIGGLAMPPLGILFMFVALYIVLGQFFTGTAMQVLTVPVVFPCLMALGFDPVWVGIIIVELCEIGTMSPPLGMNVFGVAAASEGLVTADDVFKGTIPLMAVDFVLLLLIIFIPQLALWLPSTML